MEIDLDIKLPGREEELVEALRERDLVERAMISTMEMHTLRRILELEPALRRGWTYPKVTKDWSSKRWAKAPMLAALVAMRHRLPGLAAQKLPQFGVAAMWVYHPLVTPRLARICDLAGVELIAWTVDDPARMEKLVAAGVDGICSNDPRLFARCPIEGPSPRGVTKKAQTVPGVAVGGAFLPPFFTFTADSMSSWVKPPTTSPSRA